MPTFLRVLSDADVAAIHEQSVTVLGKTGMRINSERARRILGSAGAQVDEGERRVRFPRSLVEASLASAPRQFSLGGRRPGFSLPMNAGECTLMPDGESTMVYDPAAGVRRAPTWDDWAAATKLVDTMDEVGAYWRMINSGIESSGGPGPAVRALGERLRPVLQARPGRDRDGGGRGLAPGAPRDGLRGPRGRPSRPPVLGPVLPGLTAGDGG